MADNLLRPPTPNMQGRELVQWLQRVYDVLLEYQITPAPEPPEVPSSHDELTENGGTGSHAVIASHIAAQTAHNTESAIVGITDTQTLTNKSIDADNNTITNLEHGAEVDNPTVAHGTTTAIVGVEDTQTLKNKSIYGQYNTVRNMRHGTEVDNPSLAHGAQGAVVGIYNKQFLFNKTYVHRVITVNGDYTMTLSGASTVIVALPGATIILPTVDGNYVGLEATIDNKSTGDITVEFQDDAEYIEGETSQTVPADSSMTVRFDGSGWRIV